MIAPDKRSRHAGYSLALMRLGLMFYVLLFPLGIALREIGSVWVTAALLAYYALDFKNSNLARYPLKWVYFLFLGLIVFKTLHTMQFSSSWYAFSHNIYKGPMLFLGALEFMRKGRDAKILLALLGFMSFYFGFTALFMRVSVEPEFKRYGNLMALALPAFFAMPLILRRLGRKRWLLTALFASTGTYYWASAHARSGWMGLAAAFGAFLLLWQGARRTALICGAAIALLLIFTPPGLNLEAVLSDSRWPIWQAAVEVFKEYPVLGAGINAFEPAYRGLGIFLDPEFYGDYIPHPHNIYLQFLAETGIIGFAVLLVFLFGQLFYGYKALQRKAKTVRDPWLIASCLWCSSVGYTVTALSAHNFFRTWWLGLAMTVFGAAMGSALLADQEPD